MTTQKLLESEIGEVYEFTDIEIRKDSWIYLFIGPQGAGKSLAAAYFAHKLKEKTGKKILYFPATLNIKDGEPISLDELTTFAETDDDNANTSLNKSILVIDEIHVLMNKYRSNTWGNRIIQAFLSMVRKKGVTIIGTTNSPNQLDESLVERVNFHGKCVKYTDPKCEKASNEVGLGNIRHLTSCEDAINIRMTDTQGLYGRSMRYADGKKRKWVQIPRVVNYYKTLYNTDAVVSALEVASLSKESITKAAESVKTGTSYQEFVKEMQQNIIPVLVNNGGEWIYPAAFVETLKEQFEIDATKERIGMACKDLGLENKRGSQGTRYKLPAKDKIGLFMAGVG